MIIILFRDCLITNLAAIPEAVSRTIFRCTNRKLQHTMGLRYVSSRDSPIIVLSAVGGIAYMKPSYSKFEIGRFAERCGSEVDNINASLWASYISRYGTTLRTGRRRRAKRVGVMIRIKVHCKR